ncbi:non-structural protein 10 [Taro reovirus 1]|nr:non-structural protein 10 [Taro reovirus 1]
MNGMENNALIPRPLEHESQIDGDDNQGQQPFTGLFKPNKFIRQGKTVTEMQCTVWNETLEYLKTGIVGHTLAAFANNYALEIPKTFKPGYLDLNNAFIVPSKGGILIYTPSDDDQLSGSFETDKNTGKRVFVKGANATKLVSPKTESSGALMLFVLKWNDGAKQLLDILNAIVVQFHSDFGSCIGSGDYKYAREMLQAYATATCPFLISISRFATALSLLNNLCPAIECLHYGSEPMTIGSIIMRGVDLSGREEFFHGRYEAMVNERRIVLFKTKTTTSDHIVVSDIPSEIGMMYPLDRAASIRIPAVRISRTADISGFDVDE